MKPLIRCGFGIGNRVATMANALSRDAEIRFVWRNNSHLPLSHCEVFPLGIDGVEFVDAPPDFATRWDGRFSGQSWEAAHDRIKADGAYGLIMAAMTGTPTESVDVAIMARFFRFPDASPQMLARIAAIHGDRVFVLADSKRAELVDTLTQLGIEVVLPESPEMTHDQDRTANSTLQYLADWELALSAKVIVTTKETSSAIFPAKAARKTIIFP